MAKTENLGLNLMEDETTSFGVWRKTIDGNGSGSEKSNFQIILAAFFPRKSKGRIYKRLYFRCARKRRSIVPWRIMGSVGFYKIGNV